jgi:hypothetical protein
VVSTYKGWVYDSHCQTIYLAISMQHFSYCTRLYHPAAETSRHHTISLFRLSPSCQSFVLTILLYIKERRSKFKLVLDNNAHCFKADFMLVHAVTETLVKACKCLYPCVECLMPGPGSTLLLALYKSICL